MYPNQPAKLRKQLERLEAVRKVSFEFDVPDNISDLIAEVEPYLMSGKTMPNDLLARLEEAWSEIENGEESEDEESEEETEDEESESEDSSEDNDEAEGEELQRKS